MLYTRYSGNVGLLPIPSCNILTCIVAGLQRKMSLKCPKKSFHEKSDILFNILFLIQVPEQTLISDRGAIFSRVIFSLTFLWVFFYLLLVFLKCLI